MKTISFRKLSPARANTTLVVLVFLTDICEKSNTFRHTIRLRSKVFSLKRLKIDISFPSPRPLPQEIGKCGWGIWVKDLALEKLTYQILASFLALIPSKSLLLVGGWWSWVILVLSLSFKLSIKQFVKGVKATQFSNCKGMDLIF